MSTIEEISKKSLILEEIKNNSRILGVLDLSSKIILGFNKKGIPRKKFFSLNNQLPYSVATKKSLQSSDVYAIIRADSWNENEKFPNGNLEQIIGNIGDYEAEKECIKFKYDIKWKKWNIDLNLYSEDLTHDRVDLTHLNTISIDPKGCRDIDDALHFRILDHGNIEIGVHIADVSSFIPENSEMDNEIKKRGQSVYLAYEQINMLPNEFATDMCSLLENQKRRTFSVIFTFDANGVYNVQFQKSYIINKKTMSYEEAEQHQELYNIKELFDKANTIYIRSKRTFIEEFDIHKMVEVYMVMANSAVACHLYKHIPEHTILRTHKNSEPINNNSEVLKDVIHLMNVMKLEKAEYKINPEHTNHEGLGEEFYTHFTSPIRRYADIMVHRQLYGILSNTKASCDLGNLNQSAVNIKKAERDSHLLDVVYNLYDDGSILESYGYITSIEIENDKIKIIHLYISEFKTILGCVIFPETPFNILDKVKIQVVISIKTPNIRRKILIKIL